MRSRTVFAGVAAPAVVASLGAFNRHRRASSRSIRAAKMRERVERHFRRALDRIGATDLQRDKITRIAQPLIDDAVKQMTDGSHRGMRDAFLTAWSGKEMNASHLDSIIDDHSIDLTHLLHKGVQTIAEIHAVLTPGQREQVAEVVGRDGHFGWR